MGKVKNFFCLFCILFFLSGCSHIVVSSTDGTKEYYGINIISLDENNTKDIVYTYIKGIGIVSGVNNLAIGYMSEEQIMIEPNKCQVVLITNGSDINETISSLQDVCVVKGINR